METPDKERLTDQEAADWCGISVDDWRALVKDGLIPDGARASRERAWWRWDVVIAVEILLDHLLSADLVKKKSGTQPGSTGG